MIDFVRVGKKIQELRQARGLSQDALSETLSVTRQALSRWENGQSAPSIDTLITLSRLFGVSFEEILCLDEEPELDPENIFAGHDRDFIIRGILAGRIKTDLTNVFYQFSPSERMRILMAIREGTLDVPVTEDFLAVLTGGEKKFLANTQGQSLCVT
ncbi:MAG: helix-turn-helix transcriptional regulator [Lachnospiraceae bacterium]